MKISEKYKKYLKLYKFYKRKLNLLRLNNKINSVLNKDKYQIKKTYKKIKFTNENNSDVKIQALKKEIDFLLKNNEILKFILHKKN